ncbi:MAG: preprotein translocase subunit SecY [Alphaproteobacteria bacterium HGW-Alphaproteobacteria-2]|nr:MAG: preprotein translocase subunit SecY [Alphaproteobacteria bacterium HGW-Alphaproteobacteria-2]
MASAAEQMARNLSWSTLGKARELRQRIVFALGLLIVYRIGTYIPVPGIDGQALREFVDAASAGIGGMLNMFTGGAIGRMGVFALGIMPYISASIIVQLLAAMVPSLQHWFFRASTVITLVGGTMFLMWLGEQITQRGIGNGISLIIFAGIIAEIPGALAQFLSQGRSGALSPAVIIAVLLMVVVVIAFVVFMERALRKIHIQYPRRQVGMKVYDGGSSHLPVKVNPSGVIPAIFASSLLLLPTTLSTFSGGQMGPVMSTIMAYFGPGQPLYLLFYGGMIVFFAYFYTFNVAFKPDDVAENLKNQNGFVPGIRPGKRTEEYLTYVVNRVLVVGAAYLAAVCLLPEFLRAQWAVPFYFGGTSVLIVVSVTMDTISQVQSHLLAHQYEGLIEKSQLRGKRRGKTGGRGTTRR